MIKSNGYFDIHAHILPGVDDGAADMKQTIRMLQMAASEQITAIIATPHYICGRENPKPEHLNELKCQVQEAALKINKDLRIFLGNEIYYSESAVSDLRQGKALTLAESRYVLVEFSKGERFNAIYQGIRELTRHGYMPILAHAERYICLHRKTDLIAELVKAGCYIQVNGSSITGGIMNTNTAFVRKLLNRGLVHFIGSDSHNDGTRAPIMKTAVKYLLKRCNREIAERILHENPTKIFQNTCI